MRNSFTHPFYIRKLKRKKRKEKESLYLPKKNEKE